MNQTILITGASQGLGKATAKLFINKGWNVIATMRNPEKETELTQFSNVTLLKLDITNPEEIAEAIAAAERIHPIDVLYNNAGFGFAGPLEGISHEEIQKLVNTNFIGPVMVTKAMLPYFRERKAGIVITATSATAFIPYPFISIYAATKAALESWSASLSYELNLFNIKVKTVAPGYILTDFGHNGEFALHENYTALFQTYVAGMQTEIPVLADKPEDIAATVLEVATDDTNKHLYIAGKHANKEYNQLQQEGLDAIIESMEKRFFS